MSLGLSEKEKAEALHTLGFYGYDKNHMPSDEDIEKHLTRLQEKIPEKTADYQKAASVLTYTNQQERMAPVQSATNVSVTQYSNIETLQKDISLKMAAHEEKRAAFASTSSAVLNKATQGKIFIHPPAPTSASGHAKTTIDERAHQQQLNQNLFRLGVDSRDNPNILSAPTTGFAAALRRNRLLMMSGNLLARNPYNEITQKQMNEHSPMSNANDAAIIAAGLAAEIAPENYASTQFSFDNIKDPVLMAEIKNHLVTLGFKPEHLIDTQLPEAAVTASPEPEIEAAIAHKSPFELKMTPPGYPD